MPNANFAKFAGADICPVRSIGRFGLVLCFPHRSAKIEPVPTISFLKGNGGGWIALGLVVMDRYALPCFATSLPCSSLVFP